MSPSPGLPDPSPEAVPDPSTRVAKPRAFRARRVAAVLSVASGLALGGVMAATDASGSAAKATTTTGSATTNPPRSDDYGYDDGRRATTPDDSPNSSPDYSPDYSQPHTRSGGS